MATERQVETLRRQLQEIAKLGGVDARSPNFARWRAATERRIGRIFGEESEHFKNFSSINYRPMVAVSDIFRQTEIDQKAFSGGLEGARNQLLVMIDELGEEMELAELGPAPGIASVEAEQSVADLIQVLRCFRECCQYLTDLPDEEKDVQDILWIILRSHYDGLVREETLPKFGMKSYRPDFGIPDLRVLIEVKFVGARREVPTIQESILADVHGYLQSTAAYDKMIVFVYDAAHGLRDSKKFVRDLESAGGIAEVIVIPGLG